MKINLKPYLDGHQSLKEILISAMSAGAVRYKPSGLHAAQETLKKAQKELAVLEARSEADWTRDYAKYIEEERKGLTRRAQIAADHLKKLATLDRVLAQLDWSVFKDTWVTDEALKATSTLHSVVTEAITKTSSPGVDPFSAFQEAVLTEALDKVDSAQSWVDAEIKEFNTYWQISAALDSAGVLTIPSKKAKSIKSKTRGNRKKAR